jgi:hypothetical protein
MEPSPEMKLKETQQRLQEAEAAKNKAIKDTKRVQMEVDRIKAIAMGGGHIEELQVVMKNLYQEMMTLVDDNANLRKQSSQPNK